MNTSKVMDLPFTLLVFSFFLSKLLVKLKKQSNFFTYIRPKHKNTSFSSDNSKRDIKMIGDSHEPKN